MGRWRRIILLGVPIATKLHVGGLRSDRDGRMLLTRSSSSYIDRVNWRHSNLWSRPDFQVVGHDVVLWEVNYGEDLSRYLNKIESVYSFQKSLLLAPSAIWLQVLQNVYISSPYNVAARIASIDKKYRKLLRHCQPVYWFLRCLGRDSAYTNECGGAASRRRSASLLWRGRWKWKKTEIVRHENDGPNGRM